MNLLLTIGLWILYLSGAVLGICIDKAQEKVCKSKTGNTCIPKSSPGAAKFWGTDASDKTGKLWYGQGDVCGIYDEKRACLVSLSGMFEECECSDLCSCGTETGSQTTPQPESQSTPLPGSQTTPQPESQSTPLPGSQTTPQPESQTTPQPESQTTPQPESQTTPPPEPQGGVCRTYEAEDCTAAKTKYCAKFTFHTKCKYCGVNNDNCGQLCQRGIPQADKERIVAAHNKHREFVATGQASPQPTAANMHKLEWSDELADIAQTWADQCDFNHDSYRGTSDFFVVGQNLAVLIYPSKPSDVNYEYMIQLWYNEINDFNPSGLNKYEPQKNPPTGHYTQLVWGKTKKIGCGLSVYPSGGNYRQYLVCNYGPSGNFIGSPVYKVGPPGSSCDWGAENNLCVSV